jgi:hypothetical protein
MSLEPTALRRARDLRAAWAPLAPRFVHAGLTGILAHATLSEANRVRLEALRLGLELGDPGTWSCRFPVLAGPAAPEDVEGGLLSIVATDPGVWPPRGASPANRVLQAGVPLAPDLHVTGLPSPDNIRVDGHSGDGAAWLAARARETGRRVPADIVVSAALVAGPDGEPRLATVAGGGAKARVVARELPGARLLLCGDPEGEHVVQLEAGAPVRVLERLVWGDTAVVDRSQLAAIAAVAGEAFRAHAYRTAATRYEELLARAGEADGELCYEACLRLAAVAIHEGRGAEAEAWYARADATPIPETRRQFRVERLTGLAGAAIDAFRPVPARAFLDDRRVRRAVDDPDEPWEQIQALGAWRRLHLLEGHPAEARDVQRRLVAVSDAIELPRSLLDLGFVELRCGDLPAAAAALREARVAIAGMDPVYRVQSQAFLTWHVARLARAGGSTSGLDDLLEQGALDALLAQPDLQAAGRWRLRTVRAARAGDEATLAQLTAELSPFQAWYAGVFLSEDARFQVVAARLLADAQVDLTGMPALDAARTALQSGGTELGLFSMYAAY